MKVLHVYRTYFPDPPGGLKEAIRQIAMATESLGADPCIFTLSPTPSPRELTIDGIKVIRSRSRLEISSCNLGGLDAIQTFRRLAKATDIIHYHFPWPYADLLNLFAPRRTPKVLTYHSDIVRQRLLGKLYRPARSSLLASMNRLVATSDAYAQSSPVLTDFAWQSKTETILLGISDQTQRCWDKVASLRKFGLEPGEPYFLFIGVLRYYKGLHYLIDASASVNTKIMIVGDGPEVQALKRQCASNMRVIFTGTVSVADKFALLTRCLALILPSQMRSEAFGMALVEASMFAKPMVSCDIGTGTSFINQHGETGFVVAPGSSSALANAMNRLLSDAGLRNTMGLNARNRYESLFNEQALGKAYMSLYQSVLQEKQPASRPATP